MGPKGLSFDEFRVLKEKERSREAEAKSGGAVKGKTAGNNVPQEREQTGKVDASGSKDEAPKESNGSFAEILEMAQVQTFVVTLIFMDTFAVLAQELLASRMSAATNHELEAPMAFSTIPLKVIHEALGTFSVACLVFFAFEVGATLAIFRGSFYGHWGYLMDASIIGVQLYGELSNWSSATKLLNVVRFWRLLRLIAHMVNAEKEAHEETKEALRDAEAEIRKYQGEIKRFEVELEKEKQAKAATDEMMQSYKEEVDTLNEALKIAAMDIAEVAEADDDLLSDEDFEEDDVVDEDGFADAAGSRYDKATNKANMIREARKDVDDLSIASGSTLSSSISKAIKNQTFVVHTDGTYEKR